MLQGQEDYAALQRLYKNKDYQDLKQHIRRHEAEKVRTLLEGESGSILIGDILLGDAELLSFAVSDSHTPEGKAIVEMLLDKGMNVNFISSGARAPLPIDFTLKRGETSKNFEMVKWLIERGARVEFTDEEIKKSTGYLHQLPRELFLQSVDHGYIKGIEMTLSAYGLGIDGLTARQGLTKARSKGNEEIVDMIEAYLKNNQRSTIDKCEIKETNDDKECLDRETLLKYFEEFLYSKEGKKSLKM